MRKLLLSSMFFAIWACGPDHTKPVAQSPLDPGGQDKPTEQQSADSFVGQHGMLRVSQGKIVDSSGVPVQLKGMSLFWSQWSGQFWNASAVATTARQWGATVIRAAMGIEQGGYLDNPGTEKNRLKIIIDAAIAEGIYVIIDWHDHNAHWHKDRAVEFFSEMAETYGSNPHVIFELFNEPINISWEEVKSYAEAVIGAVRSKGAQNLVIVGSPQWSQRVDMPANNPIRDPNVAYALHFYAATHRQSLRNTASYAVNRGIALFVTEFGICEASGNGNIDYNESNQWMEFMNRHQIGWTNWALNDKPESASALKPGTNPNGNWADWQLTASGAYVKSKIR